MIKLNNDLRDKILFIRQSTSANSAVIAAQLGLTISTVDNVLYTFRVTSDGRWDVAEKMLKNNNSYETFQWAADRAGVVLPEHLALVYAEQRKTERVRRRKSNRAGLLTVKEYASQTGTTIYDVYKAIKAGELSVVKLKKDDSNQKVMYILADGAAGKSAVDRGAETVHNEDPPSAETKAAPAPNPDEVCLADTMRWTAPFWYKPTLRLKDILQVLRTESPHPMDIDSCPVKLIIGEHDFSDVTVSRYHRILDMFGDMFIVSIGTSKTGQLWIWLDPGEAEP